MPATMEEAGGGRRIEVEARESLQAEILKTQVRAEVYRDEENRFKVRAEEEEEKLRQLRLQREMMDR